MLGAIRERMNRATIRGLRWTSLVLTSHGPKTAEHAYGADFVGVLDLDLDTFDVTKGFLAQAKRLEPNRRMKTSEFNRLKRQCRRMLRLSPMSYVFIYSRSRVAVVPALAVLHLQTRNPLDLYSRTIARFFEHHFESFIGDSRISTPDLNILRRLGDDRRPSHVLYLRARQPRHRSRRRLAFTAR